MRQHRPPGRQVRCVRGVSRSDSTSSVEPSAALLVVGPGVANQYRESGFGVVSTLIHSPVKGEHPLPKPPVPPPTMHASSSDPPNSGYHGNSNSKIPKVDFPRFDGDHPKLWLSDCLDYFSLYHVESTSWVQIARLHFVGAAKRWYNSVESQL